MVLPSKVVPWKDGAGLSCNTVSPKAELIPGLPMLFSERATPQAKMAKKAAKGISAAAKIRLRFRALLLLSPWVVGLA